MKLRTKFLSALVLCLPAVVIAAGTSYEPGNAVPPPPAREFRAAWITEVAAHPDWPSQPGLPVVQQKMELVALLDGAQQLHLNAVFFQVRPASDAFYASPLEPWSDRITGLMGQAPQPFYDPLAFAITEAHKRGLQLHAWFNPFRAAHPDLKSPPAANHVTRTHPELIRRYDGQVWLDPGEPEAQARTLAVVLDVVKRYDVDGIVFDDYFYPYPAKNWLGKTLDFPDDASWLKYGLKTGRSRDDWRRNNVNQLIQKISPAIKAAKPWVQFGVSPFGIWRPGVPTGLNPKALDAYGRLYADSRLWLASGWVDFLAPQLYWPVASREQSFPVLFDWWRSQNTKGRHVWPGLTDASVGNTFANDEIVRQLQFTRQRNDPGAVHYHLRSVLDNPALAATIRAPYAQPVLVPLSPWLAMPPPLPPKLLVEAGNHSAHVRWENSGGEPPRWWLLQSRTNGIWTVQVFPAGRMTADLYNVVPDAVALRAVDRLGNLSPPVVWSPGKYSPPAGPRQKGK